VTGKLPCSLDECTTLAAIQLRIEELEWSVDQRTTKYDDMKRQAVRRNLFDYTSLTSRKNIKKICYKNICNCFNAGHRGLFSKKPLIAPSYYKLSNVMKLVKVGIFFQFLFRFSVSCSNRMLTLFLQLLCENQTKKERLSKTSYYDNQLKLKEFYVKICKNFPCYGCILFQIKEVVTIMPSAGKLQSNPQFTYSAIKKVQDFHKYNENFMYIYHLLTGQTDFGHKIRQNVLVRLQDKDPHTHTAHVRSQELVFWRRVIFEYKPWPILFIEVTNRHR
jgi:hypothetical protein